MTRLGIFCLEFMISETRLQYVGEKLIKKENTVFKLYEICHIFYSYGSYKAIVKMDGRNILGDNWGPIMMTKIWANPFLKRIGLEKGKGNSSVKTTVKIFESLKEQYLLNIKSIDWDGGDSSVINTKLDWN